MRLSYSEKDYAKIKEQLIEAIPGLTDKWTDFLESDIGVVLISQMAAVGDMLAYSLDRQAGEVYVDSIQERKNIKSVLSVIGYRLRHYRASTTNIVLKSLVPQDLTFEKYTPLLTSRDVDGEPLRFVLADTYTIGYSDTVQYSAKEMRVIQGVKSEVVREYKDIYSGNRIMINDSEIAEGSTTLNINDEVWEEIEDVYLTEKPLGKFYHIEVDVEENTVIVLPYRWRDLISVPADMSIMIEFVLTIGARGNTGRGVITEFENPVLDDHGNDVRGGLSILQESPARGGSDPESIEEARTMGPRRARTVWTAITKDDYEVLAMSVVGVKKAKAVDLNDSESGITLPFIVRVLVVPDDLTLPSEALKGEVLEFLEPKKVATIDLDVLDPQYVDVDIEVDVYLREDFPEREAEDILEKSLVDYFDTIDFGANINRSRLTSVLLRSSRFVDNVVVTLPSEDVEIGIMQYARIGNLVFNFINS